MKKRTLFMVTLPIVFLLGSSLSATEVYLNEILITGAKDQRIERATIYIDKNGDVRISAPGYNVQEVETATKAPSPIPAPVAPPPLKTSTIPQKKYFIVTEVTRVAATGYSIKAIVNDKHIKTFSDDIQQNILEVTDHLQMGPNTVNFQAYRPSGKTGKIAEPIDTFSLIFGAGHGEEGGDLTIDKILCEVKVLATDVTEKTQKCAFRAQ